MYTTSVPVEENVVDDIGEDIDEPIDDVDVSFIEMEDEEIRYLIKHFAKSGRL